MARRVPAPDRGGDGEAPADATADGRGEAADTGTPVWHGDRDADATADGKGEAAGAPAGAAADVEEPTFAQRQADAIGTVAEAALAGGLDRGTAGDRYQDNLVLLCRRHHRAVHEEGFRLAMDAAGDVRFAHPDGRPLVEAPPAPPWTGPALQPTDDGLAAAGIEIGADTATPSWRGERLDLDWAMHVLWRPRREPTAE